MNREKAMKELQANLDLEIKKKEEEMKKLQGEQTDIGWGNQIISICIQVTRMQNITEQLVESGNIKAVMDWDIDDFVNAYLRWIKTNSPFKIYMKYDKIYSIYQSIGG